MICISTSQNLLDSVLHRAGQTVTHQYRTRSKPSDALLLEGGATKARKILFVPWKSDFDATDQSTIQKVCRVS